MKLENYLNELFGLFAPTGDKVVEPIINKMNEKTNDSYKSCDKVKDENQKQICIKENIIKVKKETRQELLKSYTQCEGRRPCHRFIATEIMKIDKEIPELNKEINELKRR